MKTSCCDCGEPMHGVEASLTPGSSDEERLGVSFDEECLNPLCDESGVLRPSASGAGGAE
jgi:hypothetical protein